MMDSEAAAADLHAAIAVTSETTRAFRRSSRKADGLAKQMHKQRNVPTVDESAAEQHGKTALKDFLKTMPVNVTGITIPRYNV